MKKFFALAMTLVMTLSLAACGDKAQEEQTEKPGTEQEQVEEKPAGWWKEELTTVTEGKLTVATSPDFAPYEFYAIDENGKPQLAGFDIALAQYIADYTGLELEIIPMDFDGTIMEVSMKNVDLGMAGYSPDPDRAGAMDFSDVYITGGQSFVCLKDNADKFPDLASANKPEYQIGAQVGSIQAKLAHENTPDADIIELAKVPDLLAELLTGKMDGAFIETMVAEAYAIQYPELSVVLDVPYDSEGSVIGITKGNEALVAAVNEAIAAAKDDGSFDQYVVEANELASSGKTAELKDGQIVTEDGQTIQ